MALDFVGVCFWIPEIDCHFKDAHIGQPLPHSANMQLDFSTCVRARMLSNVCLPSFPIFFFVKHRNRPIDARIHHHYFPFPFPFPFPFAEESLGFSFHKSSWMMAP
eukprot:gnl/TRDRNA2_/TRDRNA2_117745_c2_seq1.p1 gnl/TRDRNA2_/TRDRNA2_117745_c2~~gnl/TRDRNA2_/TRDRNA2_117745_c2_seq1.p1  ORF type:complete len:106 (-),score=0.46 gnl/TRDRNA2_/TRDRNA2_117745_c2_seq1:30-347(-)